ILKIKRSLRIVIRGEFHFVTDVSDNIHLNILVEIKRGNASLPFRDLWILVFVDVQSEDQFGSSLWPDVDGISSENPVESLRFYLKLRSKSSASFFFAFLCHGFGSFLFAPVIVQRFLHVVVHVFLKRHYSRIPVINYAADALVDVVISGCGII